jgi:hypothetical protein
MMSIQEQITALLNGDMSDEAHVAELMHVLAVSPEKRALLVEQVAMSRAFTSMGAGVVPPGSADMNVLSALSAVDAAIAGHSQAPAAADPVAVPLGFASFKTLASLLALLLVAAGLGAGYAFWGRGSAPAAPAGRNVRGADPSAGLLAVARDSVAQLRARLAALDADHRGSLDQIKALRERPERVRVVYRDRTISSSEHSIADGSTRRSGSRAIAADHSNATANTDAPANADAAVRQRTMSAVIDNAALRSASPKPAIDPRSELLAARAPSSVAVAEESNDSREEGVGRWQVGLRDNFRLSLPRVYGLAGNRSILFDKDVMATYRMGEGEGGLLSAFRLGLSAGETEFSQILHTNTGGVPVDTVIEQSPTLQYVRLLLAPELIRTEQMTGSVELGAGGAMQHLRMIGPVATFGLNLEYRPIDLVSIQAGASSWLLWTDFRNQSYVSTNLNAHLGFAVGF